jgi:hypothetical protein
MSESEQGPTVEDLAAELRKRDEELNHKPGFQIALVGGRLNVEGSFCFCEDVDSFIEALQVAAAGHLTMREPIEAPEPPRPRKKRRPHGWKAVKPGSFAEKVLNAAKKLKSDDPQKVAKFLGLDGRSGVPMAISNLRKGGLLDGVSPRP